MGFGILILLDDVTLHANYQQKLIKRFQKLLKLLIAADFKYKLSKCLLLAEKIYYMKIVVYLNRLWFDDVNSDRILQWP